MLVESKEGDGEKEDEEHLLLEDMLLEIVRNLVIDNVGVFCVLK